MGVLLAKGERFLKRRRFELMLAAVSLLYIAALSYVSTIRYLSLHSNYYDLGIMDQTVYNTAQGHFLELSNPSLMHNTSRLAIHVDPIIAVFAPLYRVYPSPVILLVGQTVILAAGAWAVFYLALAVIKSKYVAFIFSVLYLLYYPMQNANLFDFHAVNIATTGLLFMFLFLAVKPEKTRKYNLLFGLIAFAVSILSKEDIPLATGSIAALCWLRGKDRSLWLTLFLVSMAVFAVELRVIMPYFNGWSAPVMKYYDFRHPLSMIGQAFTVTNLQYVLNTLLPFGFLSLLDPLLFLLAVPQLLVNILSSNANMSTLYFQYSAPVTPFVVISAVYGYAHLRLRFRNKLYRHLLLLTILTAGLYVNFTSSNLYRNDYHINPYDLAIIRKWQGKLQDGKTVVSASGTLAPFFTRRRYFIDFLFDPSYKTIGIPEGTLLKQVDKYEKAKYVILYKQDVTADDPLIKFYYQHLLTNANYRIVDRTDGVSVYEK